MSDLNLYYITTIYEDDFCPTERMLVFGTDASDAFSKVTNERGMDLISVTIRPITYGADTAIYLPEDDKIVEKVIEENSY